MDNTDIKRKVILFQKRFNPVTGEKIIRTKPKNRIKIKRVLAKGRGRKTIGAILIARLQPLRFAMITGLNRKGINTLGLDLKNIVIQYYNNFSGNKPILVSKFINNFAFKITPNDTLSTDIDSARNQTAMMDIETVVSEIIRTFREAEAKFDNMKYLGLQPNLMLSDENRTQAKAVKLVKKKLIREEKQDHFLKVGQFRKTILWIAGIFFAYYLFRKL